MLQFPEALIELEVNHCRQAKPESLGVRDKYILNILNKYTKYDFCKSYYVTKFCIIFIKPMKLKLKSNSMDRCMYVHAILVLP